MFSEHKDVEFAVNSELEYHYAAYFLSVCGCKALNVNFCGLTFLTDTEVETMSKYLCSTSTEIISFRFAVLFQITENSLIHLQKIISCQRQFSCIKIDNFSECHNFKMLLHSLATMCSVIIHTFNCQFPESVEMCYDIVCKHSLSIKVFRLSLWSQDGMFLNKRTLNNLGNLVSALKTLQALCLNCSFAERVTLGSSDCFCTALCSSKSLHSLQFDECYITSDDCKSLKKVLQSNNCNLRFLTLSKLDNTDSLAIILDGLACNRTITMFSVSVDSTDGSNMFQGSFLNCLKSNQSLKAIDFTSLYSVEGNYAISHSKPLNILKSSSQVCSICTGLQSNSTLALLDICGCYIDKTASKAVCVMLKLNKSLKYLFLDPSHMEKLEALAIIHGCNANFTLEVLSLCYWPDTQRVIKRPEDSVFSFAHDEEIKVAMNTLQLNQKILKIIWLVFIVYTS